VPNDDMAAHRIGRYRAALPCVKCIIPMLVNPYNGAMPTTIDSTGTDVAAEIPLRVRGCCQPVAPRIPGPDAEECAAIFRALGDTTRLQMIHMLAEAREPVCVCDFTAAFDLGQPTISHHLKVLHEAGLVDRAKRGVWVYYQARSEALAAIGALIGCAPL